MMANCEAVIRRWAVRAEPVLAGLRRQDHLGQREEQMARKIPDIEILGPEDADRKEAGVRARFWPTVRRAIRHVPFIEDVVAAYYAMLDPNTPTRARLTLVAALAYFVAPFDLVPDMILGLGFLDDASILAAAIAAVSSSIKEEHREAARRALAAEERA
jgi:uncharacterized membrane protein YkvA (DUF1232 family)